MLNVNFIKCIENSQWYENKAWSTLVKTNDYYPFGLAMNGRTSSFEQDTDYRYGFNGKEKDNSFGKSTVYDYGLRIYNPSIGKFLSVDPLFQTYPYYSPYQYAGNNPIRFIDLDGLERADPFPDAYYRDAPKIDMTNGPRGNLTAEGHPRSARYFWKRMLKEAPEMLSSENKARIRAGKHVEITVDDQWIKHNPTTKNFKGDQLIHHHIDQGNIAAATPKTPHQKLTKLFHSRIKGGRMKGSGKVFGLLNLYQTYNDFFGDDPHDLNMLLSSGNKLNTLYYDNDSEQYFNITSMTENNDGSELYTYDVYDSYSYDKEEERYIGIGYKGTRTRTQKDGQVKGDHEYKEL